MGGWTGEGKDTIIWDNRLKVRTIVTDDQYLGNKPHAYGGFQNVATTITIAAANTWYHITNATNNLWVCPEAVDMTFANDVLTINRSGDYDGVVSVGFSALNGKDYFIRCFNTKTNIQQGYILGATTTGAGNYANVSVLFV